MKRVIIRRQPELAACPVLTLWLDPEPMPPYHFRTVGTIDRPMEAQIWVILEGEIDMECDWSPGMALAGYDTVQHWRERRAAMRADNERYRRLFEPAGRG